jgi:pyruvate-ferredoxin/flavodoxin oxidoreductase
VHGLDQQKLAVQSGHWPLFRFNPALEAEGKNPFVLDSKAPSVPLESYIYNETRYTMLRQNNPPMAAELLRQAQHDVELRWKTYEHLAQQPATSIAAALQSVAASEQKQTKETVNNG